MNRLSNVEPYGMHGYTPEKEDLLEAATERLRKKSGHSEIAALSG